MKSHGSLFALLLSFTAQTAQISGCTVSPVWGEVRVGVLTELTGPNAANGADCVAAVRAAADQHKDMPPDKVLSFAYGDHAGDAKIALTEFRRITEREGTVAVIGNRSQVMMPINPISRAKGIPLLGLVGHPLFTKNNEFALRVYPSVRREVSPLIQFASTNGLKKVSTITTDDEWLVAFEASFAEQLSEDGGTIVERESSLPEESDFRNSVVRIVAKRPDAILINVLISQAGPLIKRIRDVGFTGPILSNFWGGHPDAIRAAGAAADGVTFSTVDGAQPKFLAALRQVDPKASPTAIPYCCYVAAEIMYQACAQGRCESRSKTHSLLESLSVLRLPDGDLEVRDREVLLPVTVRTVRNGVVVGK